MLGIWCDAGFLGVIALIWIVLRAARLIKAATTTTGMSSAWLQSGLHAALVAFGIHRLVEANLAIV